MEPLSKTPKAEDPIIDMPLYRALAVGDVPSAYVICKDIKQPSNPATSFNRGLCLYILGEWEKALTELKRAEQSYCNFTEYDIADRRLFLKAFETASDGEALLPLDPEAPKRNGRYALIRSRWLIALCLGKLGRASEAAPIVRFLAQYNIKINL